MLEINRDSINEMEMVTDDKNQNPLLAKIQQKLKQDTDKELERINIQLKESVEKLRREQEQNEQNMKNLRDDYERQLKSERSKASQNQSFDMKRSYVSTDAKRVVRIQEVTLDSQDNKSIIEDTLTDELDISVGE